MIDIHTHILFGIDDGSKSIEESIDILKKAQEAGVTDVVLTPHYITASNSYKKQYSSDNKEKKALKKELDKKIKEENININTYLGNEIFILDTMVEDLKKNSYSINGKKYILMELSRHNKINNLERVFDELKVSGYLPIVAHPERYEFVQKDPNVLIDYINQGILFQINVESFYGKYGKNAKKTVIKILKANMAHFLATDVHRSDSSSYMHLKELTTNLTKYVSSRYIDELVLINPRNILENKMCVVREPRIVKKSLFERIFRL